MKINILSLLLFFVHLSCRNISNASSRSESDNQFSSIELKPTFDSLVINSKVKAAIDSFVVETNCNDCIHEIYVDKLLPDSIIITLKARVYSSINMEHVNALYTVKIENCTFYVYAGLEDIFKGNKKIKLPKTDSLGMKFAMWSLLIKKDNLSILKDGYDPFFPGKPPTVEILK